jgi:exonuclease SbcC
MKILVIRGKNLASLEGQFVIDFTIEPLKSAGIFAITGPTGAGKSTLLDAVCLALFSKTPRHLQAKESGIELKDGTSGKLGQGDVRGILRKGSRDCYAEVEFIGLDDVQYKANWSVRRARNNADGNLQADTMELTNMATNSIFPEKKTGILKEIERLVGLNFEQFSRSVLLAQGDFTAFLKADKDEKSSLLEKLTGTDIYSSISKLIYQKFKLSEQSLLILQRQVEGIVLLSEEELLLFNRQKEKLEAEIKGLDKEKNLLVTEINWHQTLIELTIVLDNAETIWRSSEKEKEEANDRIKHFVLVESVQDSNGLYESRTGLKNLCQHKTDQLAEWKVSMNHLSEQLLSTVAKLEAATVVFLQKQTDYKEAIPEIEKAKESDILIKEKHTPLSTVKNEWSRAVEKKQNHLLKTGKKEEEILCISRQLEELNKWKNENISRQPIADNIILINSKLADLNKLVEHRHMLKENIEATHIQNKLILTAISVLEKEVTFKNSRLQELTTDLHEKNNLLAAVAIDDIKSKATISSSCLEKTILARGCWELLYATQQEHDTILLQLMACQKTLVSNKEELLLQNNNLQEASVKKDHLQKLLSLARLENDKDVENMRSQLSDGDSCPVCGSIHHPYAGNNKQLQHLLEGIIKEFKEGNACYENLVKECSRLTQLGVSMEQEKINLEERISLQSIKIKDYTRKWQAFEPDKRCTDLPPAERLSWLHEEIDNLRTHIKDLQTQVNSYDRVKLSADLQKREIDKLDKELMQVREQLKEKQRDQLTTGNELIRFTFELKQCEDTMDGLAKSMDPFFNHSDWIIKWRQDTVSFIQKIKTFAAEWNNKMQLLESCTIQSGLRNTEMQGFKDQLEGINIEVKTIEIRKSELEENYSALLVQRKALFNGESTESVEQRLKQSIELAQHIQNDCKLEKDNLEGELTKVKANIEQLNKDIYSFNKQVADLSQQIQEWIQLYNLNHTTSLEEDDLSDLLAFTPAWIIGERKFLTQIEETITITKAVYAERTLQLSSHIQKKLSDRSRQETEEKLTDLQTVLDTILPEKNEIDFKLRQDIDHKNQVGSLVTEMESKGILYENWQKLNDLLGSADGKKFRQIAQEYTMDTLLGYANIHLKMLSNRYKLSRIPGFLALQVVDNDMGDEIRSVHSLSGGESFLVSLALALGLASLSSNRMKVESLFIDEGFGSLDPATLNIAMDALERLHNQGRKVGVISHVQEMTERIQTQIRVSKFPNGKSKVEVTGSLV